MPFLYFLPEVERGDVNRQLLTARGLAGVFSDLLRGGVAAAEGLALRGCGSGPGGTRGTLANTGQATPGYDPAHQTWKQMDGYWLGIDRRCPPTPDDLRRNLPIAGYEYVLGDGQAWVCPVLRAPNGKPYLPRSWYFEGKDCDSVREEVLAEYAETWALAGRIWDVIKSGQDQISIAEALSLCVGVLSVNYRVGRAEVSALRLVTSDNARWIFGAAVDLPLLEQVIAEEGGDESKKNKVVQRSSSEPGPPADSPTTAPAVPS